MIPWLCVAALAGPARTDLDGFVAARAAGAIGARLGLQVGRAGAELRRVPLDTPVCSGDRVVLTLEPASAGRLWLLNHGSSGREHLIYPDPGAPPSVRAGETVRLPARDSYVVWGPAGTEEFRVYLAGEEVGPEPTPRLTGLVFRSMRLRDIGLGPSAYIVSDVPVELAFSLHHARSCGPLPSAMLRSEEEG